MKKITTMFLLLMVVYLSGCKEDAVEPELFGSIDGWVRDAETNAPLEGVTISTNPATEVILSDGEGRFQFEDISAGNYSVIAEKNGYARKTVSVSVKNGDVSKANILLGEAEEVVSPDAPQNPNPVNSASDLNTTLDLSWSKPGVKIDSVYYDVMIYRSDKRVLDTLISGLTDTMVTVSDLSFATNYFWQVKAYNAEGKYSNSEVWSFSTVDFPDNDFFYAKYVNGNYDIYSSDSNEVNQFRLTKSSAREWYPRYNPERNLLAFTSDEFTEPHIYISSHDGSDVTQITSIPVIANHNQGVGYTWSPEGNYLIYPHYNLIYRVDYRGLNRRVLAEAPEGKQFHSLDWSPKDNSILALVMGENFYESQIYLINPQTSEMDLLVEDEPGALGSPKFSSDGNSYIFTQDISGFENSVKRQLDSRIMMKYIGNDTTVVDLSWKKEAGTNDIEPSFSNNGAYIIFTNYPNNNPMNTSLWIMDTHGENRRKIIDNARMGDWK